MGIFGKPPDQKPAGGEPPAAAAQPGPSTSPPAPSASRGVCVIGSKTTIKGEVTGDENVVVEGIVEGQVRISRDLQVAAGGLVKASVDAQSVVVAGEVVGDCAASQRVELQASGKLVGNIRAPRIVIAEGALFKGTSDMSARRENRKDKAAAS
jgi:cytoskeletal protein CcmA (bactofilin family)